MMRKSTRVTPFRQEDFFLRQIAARKEDIFIPTWLLDSPAMTLLRKDADGLPSGLRCVLHRPLNFNAHSRNAQRQTGQYPLRSAFR